MIALAIIGFLSSLISPYLGLIFVIGIGGKKLLGEMSWVYYSIITSLIGLSIGFQMINFLTGLMSFSVTVIIPFSFFFIFKKIENFEAAFFVSSIMTVLSGIGINIVIKKFYLDELSQYKSQLLEVIKQQESEPKNIEMLTKFVDNLEQFAINNFDVIWSVVMMLCIFLGVLILNKRNQNKWNLEKIIWPYWTVYVFLMAIILALIPQIQSIGIKLTLILGTLFMIQGFSIMLHFWGEMFRRSKFLTFILILALILNPYVMLLIALIGLSDIWFNYRKLGILEE